MRPSNLLLVALLSTTGASPTHAQDTSGASNHPKLLLTCTGVIACNGTADFTLGQHSDQVAIRVSLKATQAEDLLMKKINSEALPKIISRPSFTIKRIVALDVQPNPASVAISADFVTTGGLEGTQRIFFKVKNGSALKMLFPLVAGSVGFELHGWYNRFVPANMIGDALLSDAKHNTESMLAEIIAKQFDKENLFSYIASTSSTVNAVRVSSSGGNLNLIAGLDLMKKGTECALQRAMTHQQVVLAPHATLNFTAQDWSGLSTAVCDQTAKK